MHHARGFALLLCGRIHVRAAGLRDDEAIARLAGLQHGIVERRQLLDLRLSPSAIDHRMAVGRLRRLHPGVYAVGHEAIGFPGRAMAAALSMAPEAAVGHHSGAALWTLEDSHRGAIAVTAARGRRPRAGVKIYRGALPADEVAFVTGIPVTTVPRLLLDISATDDLAAVRRLVKQAEFKRLTGTPALAAILVRHPRRRGRRNLATIVRGHQMDAGLSRSELEDRFADFLAERGLPLPERNVTLSVGDRRFEVDCLWRGARLIVELDGRAAHATPDAFQADRARDRALLAGGWHPMRITWAQLHESPAAIEADVRAVLTREHARGFTPVVAGQIDAAASAPLRHVDSPPQ